MIIKKLAILSGTIFTRVPYVALTDEYSICHRYKCKCLNIRNNDCKCKDDRCDKIYKITDIDESPNYGYVVL